MYCPNPSCSESPERPHLLIADRSGIEIDYCPKCRGVWLDRGELDKLIERAQADATPTPQVAAPQREQYREPEHNYRPQERRDDRHHNDHRTHHKSHSYDSYGKPRKKSLLGEIFDF